MKLKASYIVKLRSDRDEERRFKTRYAKAGWPKIDVDWDVPKTEQNIKAVEDFVFDCYGEPKSIKLLQYLSERDVVRRLAATSSVKALLNLCRRLERSSEMRTPLIVDAALAAALIIIFLVTRGG